MNFKRIFNCQAKQKSPKKLHEKLTPSEMKRKERVDAKMCEWELRRMEQLICRM